MESIKIDEPIPKLVKLSHEYSNVNLSFDANTFTFFKSFIKYGMTKKEQNEMNHLIRKLGNNVDSFNDALEFALTTGKQILMLLDKNGVTSTKLAEILGVSVVTVSRWINGTTGITKDNLKK